MVYLSSGYQVTPLELTEKLLSSVSTPSVGRGTVEVLIDTATGIHWAGHERHTVAGVMTQSHGIIAAGKVVICLGPWSGAFPQEATGLTNL